MRIRMNNERTNRINRAKAHGNIKGMTLTELAVVLLLVALISSLTITFSLLVQKRAKLNESRNDIMKDISSIEVLTKKWIVHYDNCDYALFLGDDEGIYEPQVNVASAEKATYKPVLIARNSIDGTKQYRLRFSDEDNTLVGEWFVAGEGNQESHIEDSKYFSEYVRDVQFALFTSNDSYANKRRLVKMDVTYYDSELDDEKTITMLFTTHAQATITDH